MHPRTFPSAALIAQAQAAGEHAQAWFLALLAILVVVAGLAAALSGANARSRQDGISHARGRFALELRLGLTLIVGSLLAFSAIAYGVGSGGTLIRVDQAFSSAVQSATSGPALQVFEWITWLGDGRTLAVMCVGGMLLLWARGERTLAVGLVVAMGGNGLLNAALKRVFERMRPPHEPGLPTFHGWSFPSGHSSGALVAYGILAYVLMRTLPPRWHVAIAVLAAGAAFSVGASRIFLEAHFATDVMAGFASGTAWLTACILGLEMARQQGPSPTLASRAARSVR